MKKSNKWFTLTELLVSIMIISIIISWIYLSMSKILANMQNSTILTNIFEDVNAFKIDNIFLSYNSWQTLSWWFLLFDDQKTSWVLIWWFLDENNWFNYKLNLDLTKYQKNYFWAFYLDENTLSWILNNPSILENLKFNKWKIYKNMLLKDIKITTLNQNIFEVNLEILKKELNEVFWQDKNNTFIKKDDFIKINLNF